MTKGSFVSGAILITAVYAISLLSFKLFERPARDFINALKFQNASGLFLRAAAVALPVVVASSIILLFSNYRIAHALELSPGIYLNENWHAKEKYGAWSSGLKASIKVNKSAQNVLEIPITGYFDGYLQKTNANEREVKFYINNVFQNVLRFEIGRNQKTLRINSDFSRQDTLLTFEISDIRSPSSLGVSNDERHLGIFIGNQIRFQ